MRQRTHCLSHPPAKEACCFYDAPNFGTFPRRYLADRTATSRDGHSDNITDFLGRHLLAIFTKLNDPLLRKGASDVSPKRQALETLIFLVG